MRNDVGELSHSWMENSGHIFNFNGGFFVVSLPPYFREDLDQEEKARFGELCSSENGKGREWFARYVSAQVRREVAKGAEFLHQGFGEAWEGGLGWGNSAIAQSNGFGRQELRGREKLHHRGIEK